MRSHDSTLSFALAKLTPAEVQAFLNRKLEGGAAAGPLARPAPLGGDVPPGSGLRSRGRQEPPGPQHDRVHLDHLRARPRATPAGDGAGDGGGAGWVDPHGLWTMVSLGPGLESVSLEAPPALRHAPRDRYANLPFGYGSTCSGGRASPPRAAAVAFGVDARPGPRDTLHDWPESPAWGAGTT
jgi:hypothetical protein